MLTVERSLMSNLMDDLAKGIYKYLYESSTEFDGNHFVWRQTKFFLWL